MKGSQISVFDRIIPFIIWEHNPDEISTCQTQGKIYCSNCKSWIGCTGMYSWRLKCNELDENSADEWISKPANITKDGRCINCGVIVKGKGAINGGINKNSWFE